MSTSATDFSVPVYLDEPAGSHEAGDDSQSGGEVVDLNDPSLLAAELDANVDKNAYDAPPPLPDGFWRVKMKQLFKEVDTINGKVKKSFTIKKDKQGNYYAYTAVELQVQDPGGQFDNQKVTDNFLSTMQARNGGIPVVRVLQCLGVKIPQKVSAAWLMEALEKALAGEPDIAFESAWEGNLDQDVQERFKAANVKPPRVLGMHRFPDSKTDGVKSPDIIGIDTALGKVNLRARPRVMGYYPKDHPVSKK